MQILTSSKTNSWFTPPAITDMVRMVMGSIDLDPASCPVPQTWIKAGRYFSAAEDGLTQSWATPTDSGGRQSTIFLNPPYGKTGSKSNQEIWSSKLIKEINLGHVSQAILLTKTVPGYVWWDKLFTYKWPGPVCITTGRLSFVQSNNTKHRGKAKAASSFWYYGKNQEKFIKVFSTIGRIIQNDNRQYSAEQC